MAILLRTDRFTKGLASCLLLAVAGCGDDNVVQEVPGGAGTVGGSAGNAGSGGSNAGSGGSAGSGGTTSTAQCEVGFATPSVGGEAFLTLGAEDDVDGDACGAEFATDVVVSSTADSVTLFVNDAQQGSQPVSGLTANFDGVLLTNRGENSNSLRAVAEMPDGSTCEATFNVPLFVDCVGPSCSLSDPAQDSDFLNAADDEDATTSGLQSNLAVATDEDARVYLLIDGQQSSDAPSLDGSTANFDGVTLEEGPGRRVQAVCADEAGNAVASNVLTKTVDTTACSLEIANIPSAESTVTPLDDADGGAEGIQLAGASGTVAGADCTGVAVVNCDEADPSFSAEGLSIDGLTETGSWDVTLSVPEETGDVEVCASVQDAAGNVFEVRQTLSVRTDLPLLSIASPSTGASYSLANTTADDNDDCSVDVEVNCVDLGAEVVLYADGAALEDPSDPNLDLSAPCTAMDGLDAPFVGRASFPGASLPTRNAGQSLALEARQSVFGLVGSSLDAGSAGEVSVTADCEVPTVAVTVPNPCGSQIALRGDDENAGIEGLQKEVIVLTSGTPENSNVELSVTFADDSSVDVPAGDVNGPTETFADVSFGDANNLLLTPDLSDGVNTGNVLLSAIATDGAGNTAETQCAFLVVDQPLVNIVTPAANAVFSDAVADDCAPGTAGLQVSVAADTDAPAGAEVEMFIGDGAVFSGVVTDKNPGPGQEAVGCVDAPEGPDQTLTVEITLGNVGTGTRSVVVDTVAPSATVAAPSIVVADRRAGEVEFTWSAVDDDGDGGSMAAYELRCAPTDFVNEAAWDAANPVTVATTPAAGGSEEVETISGFRVGPDSFCMMRGVDAGGRLTPFSSAESVAVTLPFQTQDYGAVFNTASDTASALAVPLGDINGDGIHDFAYGAVGTESVVQIFFGGSPLDTTVDVEITDSGNSTDFVAIAPLGDVNGDDIGDFAIGDAEKNGFDGRAFVYFGRPQGTPWPASIDRDQGACGADICFDNGDAGFFSFMGFDLAGGDFDGDGENDVLIVTGGTSNTGTVSGQGVYVVLGGSRLDVATGTTITLPDDDPDGFLVDLPVPVDVNVSFAEQLAAVRNEAGSDDLLLGTGGDRELSFAPAEAAPAAVGQGLLTLLTATRFDSGYSQPVRALGDVNGEGGIDVGTAQAFSTGGGARVYLRSSGTFNATDLFNVSPSAGERFGGTIAQGYFSGLGVLADLDGDSLSEILIGGQGGASDAAAALYYGRSYAVDEILVRGGADFVYTTSNFQTNPNFVGDVNGDGFNDFVIVESGSGTNAVVLHF